MIPINSYRPQQSQPDIAKKEDNDGNPTLMLKYGIECPLPTTGTPTDYPIQADEENTSPPEAVFYYGINLPPDDGGIDDGVVPPGGEDSQPPEAIALYAVQPPIDDPGVIDDPDLPPEGDPTDPPAMNQMIDLFKKLFELIMLLMSGFKGLFNNAKL